MRTLYFFLFIPLLVLGQVNENNKLPNLTPVSPKSFEFLKYGEIPVGKYTGVPNISIPIYTISAKGLDIPVSLSYHSNGFRVSEEAGWTGLGWSLNGGGAIVQVVNSFDDLGLYSNREMPNFEEIFDIQTSSCAMCPSGASIFGNCEGTLMVSDGKYNDQVFYTSGIPGYYYIPVDFLSGIRDYEPDVFKFSMPGYSGEFVLDWTNETFVCISDNKVKIEAFYPSTSSVLPSEFHITVPDGHKFTFLLREETAITSNSSSTEFNANQPGAMDLTNTITSRSYQLATIITNQADRVDFSYIVTAPVKNYPNVSKAMVRYINDSNTMPFPDYLNDNTTSINYTQQPYSYIDKITFNGGVLQFTSSNRTDQVGSKKLDKIELKKNSDAATQAIKTFNFTYDYFIGHTNGTNLDQYLSSSFITKTPQELTYRLKLTSVQETGVNPYSFQYNSEVLPKKTSLASDYWGYYNGVLTNQSLFVNIYSFGIQRGNPIFAPYEQNNRGCSLQHSKASVLERITYPTGGYTNFTYELNSFDNTNSQIPVFNSYTQNSFIVNSRGSAGPTQTAVILNNDNTVFTAIGQLSTRGCTSADLNTGANDNTKIKIEAFKPGLLTWATTQPGYAQYGLMYVLGTTGVLNGTNTGIYNLYIDNAFVVNKSAAVEEVVYNDLSYIFNKGLVIFTATGGCGTYNGTTNSSQSQLNVTYNDYSQIPAISNGAGLRVVNIDSYSAPNIIGFKKLYTYSGGKLMSPLNYYNVTLLTNYDWNSDISFVHSTGQKHVLNSNSFISPSSSASGNYVGYDTVDEYTVNNQTSTNAPNTGKISETYINYPDSGALPSMNMSGTKNPGNGLVLSQSIFDKDNNPITRMDNAYNYRKIDCFFGMKQNLSQIYAEWEAQAHYLYHVYSIGVYPLTLTNVELQRTIATNYAGNESLQVVKDFAYNNYNQLSYSKETNSNNDVIENFYSFPKDFAPGSGNTIAIQMANENILAPLIKKQLKVNNEVTYNDEYIYYKRLGSPSNSIYPNIYSLSKYKAAKSSSAPEDKILYNQYDDLGNPLDISVSNGIKTSYIWGYNDRYVIAKIENAGYTDISYNLIQIARDKSTNGTETELITALNNIRVSMPNAMVTSYTYIPLTGLSTVTDAKGYRTNYFYDTNLRLTKVTDADGKILSENEYHYRP